MTKLGGGPARHYCWRTAALSSIGAVVKGIVRWQWVFVLLVALGLIGSAEAQTSATMTQTVNQRNTIGALTVSPTGAIPFNQTATFSYVLHTAGAPAPTSETIQFMDGGSTMGAAQSITTLAAANLLPYAQVNTAQGWTTSGTAPTVTPGTGNGPDGSTSTATQIAFPATGAGATSGVTLAVPGTSYANLAMTLSVWAKSSSASTLTLSLSDSPHVNAGGSNACSVTSTWQRCTFTYTFPSNAGTGFSASLISAASTPAQTISVWGVQVEQASTAGPFVSTIGSARPTGGQGGTVTFAYSALQPGTHTITAVYAADPNYYGSVSNPVTVVVNAATPTIAFGTPSPASPATYGQTVTFTATLTPPSGSTQTPTGTVTFADGAGTICTGTINASGVATCAAGSPNYLSSGTHSITATYSGDSNFTSVTSSASSYVVNKANSTITGTSTLNPSIYGDSVTFNVTVTGAGATPTGTLTFIDGATQIGTPVTLTGGAASITTPSLTAGSHTIKFQYSGDSNHN